MVYDFLLPLVSKGMWMYGWPVMFCTLQWLMKIWMFCTLQWGNILTQLPHPRLLSEFNKIIADDEIPLPNQHHHIRGYEGAWRTHNSSTMDFSTHKRFKIWKNKDTQ